MLCRCDGDAAGEELTYGGDGRLLSQKAVAATRGTCVTATNLFAKWPVRRKIAQSAHSSTSVSDALVPLSLARPEVRFTLTVNGKQEFVRPACKNVLEAVREHWGGGVADNLASTDATLGRVHVQPKSS